VILVFQFDKYLLQKITKLLFWTCSDEVLVFRDAPEPQNAVLARTKIFQN